MYAGKMASRRLNVFVRRRHLLSVSGSGGGGGGDRPAAALMSAPALAPQAPLSSAALPPYRQQQLRGVTTRESGAVLEEPKREVRYGLLKVFLTVFAGLSIGAWVSQKMAAFLEENELFVPEDDDDDDD